MRKYNKIMLLIAAIIYMTIILAFSREFDVLTRRFGITFFGTILTICGAAFGLDAAAQLEARKLERWKAQREQKRIHHYYEIDRDSFNVIAKQAISEQKMLSFIKEIEGKEKTYDVEVRFIDDEEGAAS